MTYASHNNSIQWCLWSIISPITVERHLPAHAACPGCDVPAIYSHDSASTILKIPTPWPGLFHV